MYFDKMMPVSALHLETTVDFTDICSTVDPKGKIFEYIVFDFLIFCKLSYG